VLDSLTGQVVVSTQASRKEVMEACSRGEDSIVSLLKIWLQRVPPESLEVVGMLEMSCKIEETNPTTFEPSDPKVQSYLKRVKSAVSAKEDMAARIKTKFAELVKEGMSPNEAAAKAIECAASQSSMEGTPSSLHGGFKNCEARNSNPSLEHSVHQLLSSGTTSKEELKSVLATALKYIENAKREPWSPQYRTFKLNNKVADRIVRVPKGLELLQCIGLEISSTAEDFVASIPLEADMETLHANVAELLLKNAA
jgi:hypothetical protein